MPGEKFSDGYSSSLTSTISTLTRPVSFTVAATSADLAGGTFSVIVYDAGTDLNPTNPEIMTIADGSFTTWSGTNEPGHNPALHAIGSTVKLILTRRSLTQQMADHTTQATTANPHPQYVHQNNFIHLGDSLVGTGSGTFTVETVGADGTVLTADSTRPSGRRWGSGASTVLTHMGDLILGGLLGLVQRIGIGTIGQVLTAVQAAPVIATPSSAPSVVAVGSGGALVNGTLYDFAYAWQTAVGTPDGGGTPAGPIATFTATPSGTVRVQCPAAPATTLTLLVYASVHNSPLQLQATITNALSSGVNNVTLAAISSGASPSLANTTGGVSASWQSGGTVTSVAMSVPAEFTLGGSPVTTSGTITIGKATQPANEVYASPSSGTAAVPSFRALVPGDMPFLGRHEQFTPTTGQTAVTVAHPINVVLVVAVNGSVKFETTDYVVSGQVLTFSPFTTGDRVVVAYIG